MCLDVVRSTGNLSTTNNSRYDLYCYREVKTRERRCDSESDRWLVDWMHRRTGRGEGQGGGQLPNSGSLST